MAILLLVRGEVPGNDVCNKCKRRSGYSNEPMKMTRLMKEAAEAVSGGLR